MQVTKQHHYDLCCTLLVCYLYKAKCETLKELLFQLSTKFSDFWLLLLFQVSVLLRPAWTFVMILNTK